MQQLTAEDIKLFFANTQQITFEVTERCNLNCKYCGYGSLYNNKDPRHNNNLTTNDALVLLKKIKELLKQKDSEILEHLRMQLNLMQKEKQKLITLIDTLEKTIASQERRIAMSTREKFNGFTFQDNRKYKQAAIDMYGEEVIEKAMEKQKGKEREITDGFNEIFFAFSENISKEISAISKENIDLAEKLHKHLCKYAFDCSIDVFSSIGYGYVQNIEFKNNLDKFGEGTAQYVCDAIQQYVKQEKGEK